MATRTTALLEERFEQFVLWKSLHPRAENTVKAWRQDYAAIAGHLATSLEVSRADLTLLTVTSSTLEQAFAAHGLTHRLSSRRRCWSTWNSLCSYLAEQSLITANPMAEVPHPRLLDRDRFRSRSIREEELHQLLVTLAQPDLDGRDPWGERDFAIILTGLVTRMRPGELLAISIGDLLDGDGGKVIAARGKRDVALEQPLANVLASYLRSRADRFPGSARTLHRGSGDPWPHFDPRSPLFVGVDGRRLTRGTLQYRIKRAYLRAGIPEAHGVVAHRGPRTEADATILRALLDHALSQASRSESQGSSHSNIVAG